MEHKSKQEKEKNRFAAMRKTEERAWQSGYCRVAGLDEAGRGPLAGPVAAAACILDPYYPIYGLNDSKKLTPARRRQLYGEITRHALDWNVSFVEPVIIDEINILEATRLAMKKAVEGLRLKPDLLLIDAIQLDLDSIDTWSIVRGDSLSISIAAASILAKVTRDRAMEDYDRIYPGYGFSRHKGYGTKEHYEALLKLGPTPIHRKKFIRNLGDHHSDEDV